ncbi:copper resistance D family protein [Planococcus citreus]|uniref:Putative copper resistance protein D n=1 Tax=Planococcus citreus TaxID=1373 RepID=A0A497YGX6_9BACL|nr:CopD family protein [Planococcus citreus]RLJ86539.1 putative copper resistance protein D [Planococcus citreus]
MSWLIALSDFFLYVVLAFLAGDVVLRCVKSEKKPLIEVPKKLLLIALALIPLLLAPPVIQLVLLLSESFGMMQAIVDVTTEFRAGQSYVFGTLMAVAWLIVVWRDGSWVFRAFWLVLSVLNVAYASHAASIADWQGFAGHALHFLALVLWAGVLIHIAWFLRDGRNWRAFLKWFTPFSVVLMIILIGSGIWLMLFFVAPEDYASSWILPYGQLLLLKHLSIVPLLLAAFINAVLSRSDEPNRSWLKVESWLLLLVLLITAFMSKLAPPHNINETFRMEGGAPFVEWVAGPQYLPVHAVWTPNIDGFLMMAIGLIFLGLQWLGYRKQLPEWLSFIFGLGFVAATYIGLMFSFLF